jgi:penicillin amidase
MMPGAEFDRTSVAPSFRQVVDLGRLEASVAMYPPGQSGLLGNPHYGDLIAPWLAGEYYPVLWFPERVTALDAEVQRLLPPPAL